MDIKDNIKKGISYKEGYKYVIDEQTNFIVYQNSDDDLIIGLCPHSGKINESEIKKLYQISLNNFKVTYMGSGFKVSFDNTIYPNNFYSLTDNEVSRVTIRNAIINLCPSPDEFRKQFNNEEEINFSTQVNISNPKVSVSNDKGIYWKFENDDHVSISDMVTKILRIILECFYKIGITREYYSTYYEEVTHDYYNRELLRVINVFFNHQQFDVVEEREEDYKVIYEDALKENELFTECIDYLNSFVQKVASLNESPEDLLEASKYAKLYKKITNKTYNFADRIEDTSDALNGKDGSSSYKEKRLK